MGLSLCHVVQEICAVSIARDARVNEPKVSLPLPPNVSLRLARSANDNAMTVLVPT